MIDQADRHVYLYAKSHYRETDTIKDLQQIFAERNGMDPKYILPGDIARMLISMAYPLINTLWEFKEFVFDLDPNKYWKLSRNKYTFFGAVIGRCLSILAMTEVIKDEKVIMDLGKPDPTILPLKREGKEVKNSNEKDIKNGKSSM